jgi:dTDP-glucose 4,6-dehydratase
LVIEEGGLIIQMLVTGGAGFIGSNFIHYILKKYKTIKIINYDKLTYAGNLQNLKYIEENPNYVFIKGDICDKDGLNFIFSEYSPDYVVNFAAESHVDRSIHNPEEFIKTNVLGVQNLLKSSLDNNVKLFVQISTDEVYGSLGNSGIFVEDTPLAPNSPYAASKASADLLARAYHKTYSLPVITTRCSNNYGPYQFPEKLIPLTILKCLNREKIPVYGDGLNIRDWLYVEDHCSAIDTIIQRGVIGEVYNIGGNNEKTNIEIVKTIITIASEKLPSSGIAESLISYVEDRKGHDRRYAVDSSKLQKALGWKPAVPFEEGIRKTIEWYLNNKEWLNSIISGSYLNYYNAWKEINRSSDLLKMK